MIVVIVWSVSVREEGVVLNNITIFSSSKTTNRYEIFYYTIFCARVFEKPTEYFGKRISHWQRQGIERRRSLVFLCFFRVFMGKNAFGFCLQTEILSFWYFVNFLMRRQKSPVQKGVIQPSFCTPGKIFACVPSYLRTFPLHDRVFFTAWK